MMTDRFDAQLRQHLVTTADERPADGQLAALSQAVSRTAQRRPLAARLTWFPGRVGPFASATVRYGLVAAVLALATVVGVAIIASSPRPPSTVFEGGWTSTDPADGSTQTLVVGEGTEPSVRFVDDHATGLACRFDAVKVFTADGRGTVEGNRLRVTWPEGGGCGLLTTEMGAGTYTFDGATDTLVDGEQLTWRRAQGAVTPPTRGPQTAMPTFDPPGGPQCPDLAAGETYRNDVGPLSLTVAIPAAASFEWKGDRDAFNVGSSCWFGRPVVIAASVVSVVHAACETAATVEVGTAAEAVAALAAARGVALSGPASATLGGYAATRFEIAADAQMCFDEVRLWDDATVARGTPTIIYLVDVDGLPLGITITDVADEAPPAQVAEAESILASLQVEQVRPLPTGSATERPDDGCTQFDNGGTYSAPAGSLTLTVTIPAAPHTYWHGLRDEFHIQRAPCLLGSPLSIESSIVMEVYGDACIQSGTGVAVATAADAAAALAAQAGSDTSEPTNLTVDGNPAIRLEVSVPRDFSPDPCENGMPALWRTAGGPVYNIYPGSTWTVYLVDLGGTILAVTAARDAADDVAIPTLRQEIDAILGSLQITAEGGGF